MNAPVTAASLVGGWRLARWEVVYLDASGTERRRTFPFGPDATGLLLYTPDGWMSATIAAAGRRAFDAPNPRETPAEARAAAFDGYFSYAGRYRVDGGRVVHELAVALNPGMLGAPQVRDARLEGDRLELSASEPTADGGRRLHRLLWARRDDP